MERTEARQRTRRSPSLRPITTSPRLPEPTTDAIPVILEHRNPVASLGSRSPTQTSSFRLTTLRYGTIRCRSNIIVERVSRLPIGTTYVGLRRRIRREFIFLASLRILAAYAITWEFFTQRDGLTLQ